LLSSFMVSTRRFGRVRTRDATGRQLKAEAGLQSSYQLVAHSGGVSERADERSPAGVRLGHRPQKPVVEMSVSPGMPRLSRCRRRLGPKQPQVPRMVSLSPLGFACITLRLAVAAKRHGRLRSRQGKRQGVSSTGSVQSRCAGGQRARGRDKEEIASLSNNQPKRVCLCCCCDCNSWARP